MQIIIYPLHYGCVRWFSHLLIIRRLYMQEHFTMHIVKTIRFSIGIVLYLGGLTQLFSTLENRIGFRIFIKNGQRILLKKPPDIISLNLHRKHCQQLVAMEWFIKEMSYLDMPRLTQMNFFT